MKKLTFIIMALTLLTTACGSPQTTPPPAALTEEPGSSALTVEEAAPEATNPPGQLSPDGKILVTVTMGDGWIKSDVTTFKVGIPYRFTITNTGNRKHVFSISNPVTEINEGGMNTAKLGALVFIPDNQLVPGAIVKIDFTFTEPAAEGELEFACLILKHYQSGQYLPIIVEE